MSLIEKVRNAVGMGKEEYVVQVYNPDDRYWIDEGGSDADSEPEEYGFTDTDPEKRRNVRIKGDKVVEIIWVIGGKKKRQRKTKELTNKSPVDAISAQAQKVKKDHEKLVELKDVLSGLLGDVPVNEKDAEWMYPSMFKGLNMGLGHAFMTGMDTKKEDIASAGLNMVNSISDIMSAVPIVAVAIAKSQGVNVGMFGIDENKMFDKGNGTSTPSPSPPASNAPGIIHEHEGGFDVNTTDEELDEVDLLTEEELIEEEPVKPKQIPDDFEEEIVFGSDWEPEELANETPLVGDEQ